MSRWGKFQDVADLPIRAFSNSKFTRTYEGGGGGSTESTSYQTNLPEYAQPYFEEMMARTQGESIKPYTPYGGDRIAGFTPAQQQTQAEIMGMQRPGELAQASQAYAALGQKAADTTYTPTTFSEGYKAGTLTDQGTLEKYMSPYMQNVVDIQKREAARDYAKLGQEQAAAAIQAGAFGGGREGVQRAEQSRDYLNRLADIQATGQQQAFQQAATQFGAEQGMQQAEAQQRLATEQATEASKQFGAGFEQQQQQMQLQVAQSQENLAATTQNLDQARLQLQQAVGAEQQAMAQKSLDQAYQDFVNARDYERQQLAFYNSLLRGIPVPVQQETIQYSPSAGIGTQLAGLGIAGLGAYNQMGR
jgi:hypothetical protein